MPRRFSTTFFVEPVAASGETVVRTVCRVCMRKSPGARLGTQWKGQEWSESLTLTTQIGFERIEVAAPAKAETRIDSAMDRAPLVVFRDRRTRARASSKLNASGRGVSKFRSLECDQIGDTPKVVDSATGEGSSGIRVPSKRVFPKAANSPVRHCNTDETRAKSIVQSGDAVALDDLEGGSSCALRRQMPVSPKLGG